MSLRSFVLGRRLANRESRERKIGAFEGVPAMGLDGLGSSGYGHEAALTILIPLGAASLTYIGWIDYMLNVAVGISAGVGALVSAIPSLHPYMLTLCLSILAFITIMNLRGTLDAGRLFAVPTYIFIASFGAIILIGIYKALAADGDPEPVVAPPPLTAGVEAVSVWLLLRAFASGCTAMTGVEAVSNGMSAFRDPPVKYGHRTFTAIVVILGALLAGIAYLTMAYGIGAMDQAQAGYRSVLSQLASAGAHQAALVPTFVRVGGIVT